MASRITPAMARGIAQKWGALKGDMDYFAQPQSVTNRLGKFAKAMGYTTNQPKTTGRSYNRAAYGHMSKLAQMNDPVKERNMVMKQSAKAYTAAYSPYGKKDASPRKLIQREAVLDKQLDGAGRRLALKEINKKMPPFTTFKK
jgi:hypothetical protein